MEKASTTVQNTVDLGITVRKTREMHGLTQAKVAGLCRVGTRFISDLENGKPTVQIGKVLHVLGALGMALIAKPRESPRGL